MDESRGDVERALHDLDQTVGQAVTFFRTRVEAQEEAWGPKEVLSHMLFWHEWTVDSFEKVQAGQPPSRQPAEMAEVDRWNAEAVQARKDRQLADLTGDLAALQDRLVARVRSLKNPEVIVAVAMDGAELNAAERLRRMNHHISGHLEELRVKASA